ncbi:MAG: type II toxin-antitoxin system PemK/MazF family toxin [Thermomicrobiales bacterium]
MSFPRTPPRRGEVWLAQFDPVLGHEQGGIRPAVIVSVDSFNTGSSRMAAVIPLTTRDRGSPSHVRVSPPEGGLERPSLILCEHVRSVTQLRLRHRLGIVKPETMYQVEEIIRGLLHL